MRPPSSARSFWINVATKYRLLSDTRTIDTLWQTRNTIFQPSAIFFRFVVWRYNVWSNARTWRIGCVVISGPTAYRGRPNTRVTSRHLNLFEQYGHAVQRTDCASEPPAMSETYPPKAIGRSWALELALRITGIGSIGVTPDPILRRAERGVPPSRGALRCGIERCFFSERLKETQ